MTKGQKLLTLEAMKMEHSLVAPFDGMVAELNADAGAQVSEGRCWCGSRRGRDDARYVLPAKGDRASEARGRPLHRSTSAFPGRI